MKVSKAKVAENRAALVNAASKLLKQKGFDGAGVIEICANAGLTQGAFYSQFATKSALAAEACRQDLRNSCEEWVAQRGTTANDALAYVQYYLRKDHIDDIAQGCALAAYSGDIVRQEPEVASAFTEGAANMIILLEKALVQHMEPEAARARALFLITSLAGTVSLTRALRHSDPELAEEVLDAALRECSRLVTAPSSPNGK